MIAAVMPLSMDARKVGVSRLAGYHGRIYMWRGFLNDTRGIIRGDRKSVKKEKRNKMSIRDSSSNIGGLIM